MLAEQKQEWKVFHNALDKSERKAFDEMWDVPRLYITACSNSVSLVPLHPIAMSILFYHYKELMECSKRLEDITKKNMSKGLVVEEEVASQGMKLQQQRQQLKLSDF